MPESRERPVPSPVTSVEIKCALGGTNSESTCIPGEKSQLSFQDIPDVPLCNITVGIFGSLKVIARGMEDSDCLL